MTSEGWTRLRWAQDATSGPPFFGLAVLDNIDVNGTLVGSGASMGGGGAGRTTGHDGDQ